MSSPDYRSAPLKNATRRMVVEVCRRLVYYGPLRELSYIGLGAKEFVDFEMVYEALGVMTMYSIESEIPLKRLEYNRPFNKINIEIGTTNDRLPSIEEISTGRSVVWLDYTGSFDSSVITDLAYLASVVKCGSAIFVTLNCHYNGNTTLDDYATRFGDYFDSSVRQVAYQGLGLGNFQRDAAEQVLLKNMRHRFDAPELTRALDVRYQDSAKMQVVGWIVGESGSVPANDCRLEELDFTAPARSGLVLQLASPKLTQREWGALARQMPSATPAMLSAPHDFLEPHSLERFYDAYRYLQAELRGA